MNKPRVVVLPGWTGSQETWSEFVAYAKDTLDIVVIDLPCFGTEPCPDSVWGVEEYAAFATQKIKELNDRGITLLGHSFGGQVAVRVASAHPELVGKLILCGAAVIRRKRPVKRVVFGFIAKFGKILFSLPGISRYSRMAKKLLYKAADSPDYSKTAGIEREIFKKVVTEDQSDVLHTLQMPTKIIWGTHDTQTPLKDGREIAGQISHAEFEIIENGRHGLHHETKEELKQAILSFVT